MSDFTPWWDGLSLSLKIYWAIAIPFTFFFVLQLLLSLFRGGDVPDDTPDAEINADHGIAFQFLTVQNLVAFFTLFGWIGVACTDSGFSEAMSAVIAFISGVIMMMIMASLYYFIHKAAGDGTLKFSKAVGRSGEVYLTILRKRGNIGKVQIKVQKSLRTLEAITDDNNDIPSGKNITVLSIVNDNILLVTAK
jgi:hypothetical protein